ncbi:MAG: rod shape-determining protein RodA [Betaproteobacteria bacterium]|nr:rod shape-determining protein RodA [Betaproteobacteria bacterium]
MSRLQAAWARVRPWVAVFDWPLSIAIGLVVGLSVITMYSAAYDFPGRFEAHLRNLAIAAFALWAAALVPRTWLVRFAVPLFVAGVAMLIAVALFGDIAKGARRWLNLGFIRIQPSEVLKIAAPLMLAWYFQQREGMLRWFDFAATAVLLMVPVWLIARQPDLGTALLVLASGGFVIFLAGLSCMHDYQRQRVLTLLDPASDPLGRGFHIIQSTIAIGSGGVWGKGWMEGTQTRLEFVPERTTDFILAVFSEEFGLVGNGVLIALYLAVVLRALAIAARGLTLFDRLLAGALALVFFVYAFVNIGMVSGVLPVVGVPLPFMSYGGTAMATLGLGLGLVMGVARSRAHPEGAAQRMNRFT